ncbi:MAG: hypothetical protein ACJ8J7_12775, partial [Sulfurifustaceae bacterium]
MDDTPKQAPGDLDPADIAILKEPIAGPLSWTAATFKFGSNIIPLSDTQLAALENLHAHRGDAPSLAAAKSSLGPVAASIIEHCENISGFALVRGVDVTRYATEQLKTMFFRFCGIVGNIVTQNSK